ncbi:MAG TPA: DCC1-like thiol-disulfide oxidoreductase family protein [Stellaceae bacterium]|jgi:predicted DCC family thiol-disulfide oxidoreductase YuxK|nr:DCC1-like thiol-disulfide oxidoreductase family protein [Stellaceae bacterium]
MRERPAFAKHPYSYRDDPAVPKFPDDRPLFIFDGVCVLCSSGVRWLAMRDRDGRFRFATAQSSVGRAIYAHYGIDMDETYLLLDEGQLYGKSDGYLRVAAILGGFWRAPGGLARIIPRALRDAAYDIVARHRYRWFGKTEYCGLIPPELKERLLD